MTATRQGPLVTEVLIDWSVALSGPTAVRIRAFSGVLETRNSGRCRILRLSRTSVLHRNRSPPLSWLKNLFLFFSSSIYPESVEWLHLQPRADQLLVMVPDRLSEHSIRSEHAEPWLKPVSHSDSDGSRLGHKYTRTNGGERPGRSRHHAYIPTLSAFAPAICMLAALRLSISITIQQGVRVSGLHLDSQSRILRGA
ncbi:hypothetical protein BDV09DRAFT_67553 [Aspergillus tetrazonus]